MKEKKFVYNRESFTFGFINNNLYLNNNYYTYGEILENNQKNCIQILRKRKKKFYKPGDYVGVYPENIYVKNQFLNSIFYVFKLFKQVDLYFLKDLFKKYKSLCFKDINFWYFNRIKLENLTTKLILKILVTLKPRLYSISSNLNIIKKYIAITLSLVYLKKAYSYFGVCSTYLNILSYKYIPSYLLFFEVKSQFKINYEVDLNRILICTGAGIAPMISFFFDLNLYKLKKNWFIFGERSRVQNILYKKYIEYFIYKRTLNRIDLIFSRVDFYLRYRYLTSLILLKKNIFISWMNTSTYTYVCGSLNLYRGFKSYFIKIIQTLNYSCNQAIYFLTRLEVFKYIKKDVY